MEDFDESLDEKYDVIIRRNTWVEDIKDTEYYYIHNNSLINRLLEKNIKTVNLIGLDGRGKGYLCNMYNEGKKVIPTVDSVDNIDKLGNTSLYIVKNIKSFGSGIGQEVLKKDEILSRVKKDYIIQPKLKFKSELQCYFIGDKFMWAYEYVPSKYPNYPTPIKVKLTDDEMRFVCSFAKESNLKVGFQRIDCLRLDNDELILLEIEDNSPHMSLETLDENFRNKVIDTYKKNIYDYLER